MTNPVWVCSEERHGRNCQCGKNLRRQIEIWRAEIVENDPELRPRVYEPTIWTYPIVPCPYCGTPCECDMVNVGVGLVQCGPGYCTECGASEIGSETIPESLLTEFESITGWYEPGKPVSPLANTVLGIPVDHKTAKRLYDRGLLDSSS